ncbi:hypothetical protein EDC04DRAFT_2615050 [Pisolithus marmoratus]|nr:hypothetical protein EDC04DRAFT_2615050 [Pisolithus marmoratus]
MLGFMAMISTVVQHPHDHAVKVSMSLAPSLLSFRLPVMSSSSLSQGAPSHPLHELLAEMNISNVTSNNITWTCRITKESVMISCIPPAGETAASEPALGIQSSPPVTQAPPEHAAGIATASQQKLKPAVKSPTKPTSMSIPPIPHPSCILLPKSNTAVQGYYVIMVGQEVGIFYTWPDVAVQMNNISGNTHKQCKSFSEALKLYMWMYNKGCV